MTQSIMIARTAQPIFLILAAAFTGCSSQGVSESSAPTMVMTAPQAEILHEVVAEVWDQSLVLPQKQITTASVNRLFNEHDGGFVDLLTQPQKNTYASSFRPYLVKFIQRECIARRQSRVYAEGMELIIPSNAIGITPIFENQ